jgi:hypothetical protein
MQDNNQSSDLNNENSEAKTTSNLVADNKSSEVTNSNNKIDASKIYPDAKLNPLDNVNENATQAGQSQALAKAQVESQTADSNRAVSMRVKSLLVLGIFYFINAAITITLSSWLVYLGFDSFITNIGKIENILFIASIGLVVVQLILAVYLIFSKDNYRVAFILKIFLVLQLLSVLSNLFNLTALVVSSLFLIFIWYVYSRVKNLNYL